MATFVDNDVFAFDLMNGEHDLGIDTLIYYLTSNANAPTQDEELLAEVFSTSRVVVTVEEHTVLGGLGGAVAEWLTSLPVLPNGRLLRIGTPDAFLHEAADQTRTRSLFGLDAETIAQKTLEMHRTIVSHGSEVKK